MGCWPTGSEGISKQERDVLIETKIIKSLFFQTENGIKKELLKDFNVKLKKIMQKMNNNFYFFFLIHCTYYRYNDTLS